MTTINFADLLGKAQGANTEKEFLAIFVTIASQEKLAKTEVNTIVNIGVERAVNDMHNSKSVKRINLLVTACKQAKNSRLVNALAMLPAFLDMENCLAYDKKSAVFYKTNSLEFDNACASLTMPEVAFFDWLDSNKQAKKRPAYTETRAISEIRQLFVNMRNNPLISQQARFAELYAMLEKHIRENDNVFLSQIEIDNILNS